MLTTLTRSLREGLKNFMRNGSMSIATLLILVFSLYIIGALIFSMVSATQILNGIRERINVSVYFNSDTSENDIMKIKEELEKYKEVKSAVYVSKEQALEDFKKKNANEPVILQSLDEIGENPLLSSLVIRAVDAEQYDMITTYLKQSPFADKISRINFEKNRELIERIGQTVSRFEKAGLVLSVILILIAIIITFNTIRITIYSRKQEIEIMRLVGASNAYIRLPFIFEGAFYGIASAFISMILLLATVKVLSFGILSNAVSSAMSSYLFMQAPSIFIIQLAIGTLVGVVGSVIAMRKYLKI
jgi:cell division transport system permease protein